MSSSNYYKKSGDICPSPSDVVLNSEYAFTFNPQIQPLTIQDAFNSSVYQFDISGCLALDLKGWWKACSSYLSALRGCELSKMVCEISKNGRYHFHGCITITNKAHFYTFAIPVLKAKSHYAIVPICQKMSEKGKYENWDQYLKKDQDFMIDWLKENGINPEVLTCSQKENLVLQATLKVSRDGKMTERKVKEYVNDCRICQSPFKSSQRKKICCSNCEKINYMPNSSTVPKMFKK